MNLQVKYDAERVRDRDKKSDNEIWHYSFGDIIQPFIMTLFAELLVIF